MFHNRHPGFHRGICVAHDSCSRCLDDRLCEVHEMGHHWTPRITWRWLGHGVGHGGWMGLARQDGRNMAGLKRCGAGGFQLIMVSQNGWFIMDYPIKMDDLGRGTPNFRKPPYMMLWTVAKSPVENGEVNIPLFMGFLRWCRISQSSTLCRISCPKIELFSGIYVLPW